MNRLFRKEAAEFIGCGVSTLDRMHRMGLMEGTYYTFGNRIIYITDELEKWIRAGGELGAYERKHGIKAARG